jgi:PKD repeat protein
MTFRTRYLIILLLLVSSILFVPVSSVTADQPDSCSAAPLVNATGTNSGTINSTDDVDAFRIPLTEGDRVEFSASVPPAQDNFDVEITDLDTSYKNISNGRILSSPPRGVHEFTGGLEGSWELWAEESGTACVSVSDTTGDAPYDWEVTTEASSPSDPDQWADSASDAQLVDTNGTYTGVLNTPDDADTFKLRLDEGDHVDFGALVPPAQDNFDVEIEPENGMRVSYKNISNAERYDINRYPTYREGVHEFTGGLEGSWELWAEESGMITVTMTDLGRGATVPYEWQLTTKETPRSHIDSWNDTSSNADLVKTNGTYNGYITTPADGDTFKLRLDEGDHVDFGALVPPAQDNFDVEIEPENGMRVSYKNISNAERYDINRYPTYREGVHEFTGGLEGSWELWAEESGIITVTVTDLGRGAAVPYDWQLTAKETPRSYADKYPDSFSNANRISANDTYQGWITTPEDSDAITILLEEGETVYAQTSVPPAQNGFSISVEEINTARVSVESVTNANKFETGYPNYQTTINDFTGDVPARYEIHAESSGAVALTFGDGSGAAVPYSWSTSLSRTESFDPIPPLASLIIDPAQPTAGENVTFDAGDSVDPDGQIVEYQWDFGNDGTIDQTSSSPSTTYTYSEAGNYQVNLTVVDATGTTNTTVKTISIDQADSTMPTTTFNISSVRSTSPVTVGEKLTLITTINNTGSERGTTGVTATSKKLGTTRQNVTLDSGDTIVRNLTLQTSTIDAGSYDINIIAGNQEEVIPVTIEATSEDDNSGSKNNTLPSAYEQILTTPQFNAIDSNDDDNITLGELVSANIERINNNNQVTAPDGKSVKITLGDLVGANIARINQ